MTETQQRQLDRIESLRRVKAAGPGEPSPGLTDRELARQLTLDMLQTLVRAEIVIQAASDTVVEVSEQQIAASTAASTAITARHQTISGLFKLASTALNSKAGTIIASCITTILVGYLVHLGVIAAGGP